MFSLNPESAHGHALYGWIRFKQGRIREAVEYLKAAVSRDPNHVEATKYLAIVLLSAGKPEAAGPVVERLLAIDPLTPVNHTVLGYWMFMERRVPEALACYRRAFEMAPQATFARVVYARSLALAGAQGEAKALHDRSPPESADDVFEKHGLVHAHILEGREDAAALALSQEGLVEASRYDEHLSWWMADWNAALGEPEKAVDWLRHALEIGFLNYPMVSELDAFLDDIRDHPAYLGFEEELKARWEALEF